MAINEPGQSPWDKRKNVPPNLEQFLKQLQQKFKFKANLFNIWLILAVVLVVWALTGIYIVDPDELGVVRRFGKMTAESQPGIHYAIPLVQQVDVVKVARIRSMELGFRTIVEGPPARIRPLLVESLMITGDENLVNLKVVVQYRISDLPDYLFRVFDPRGSPEFTTLRDAAETALRGVVGSMTIDDILTVGRARVQQETKVHLQQLMDSYQTGLLITEVKLQAVEPPEPVQAAFKDVVSAKEDRERIINEARGYLEDILPKARGEAEQMLRAAEGYGEQRVAEAKGETERFLAMLVEYRQARTVTRRRLYLETMGEVLSKVDKVVISAQVAGRMLPLLPLADLVPRAEGRAPKSGEPQ
ncbi:MAG: FtsH protease activity modulator HflK [SAR324 cluster bacterium]|nr:FtsH protease activity modulator HflK [SAR324 cluster bacterium]